jgi:hypothetical protein
MHAWTIVGRKKKVRLHLKPYCAGDVPDEIGRDLIVLQDLAALLRELEALRPHRQGIERLWRGQTNVESGGKAASAYRNAYVRVLVIENEKPCTC